MEETRGDAGRGRSRSRRSRAPVCCWRSPWRPRAPSGTRRCARPPRRWKWRASTAAPTTSPTPPGARPALPTCASLPRATPTAPGRWPAGRTLATSATGSSTRSAWTSSPSATSASGRGCGGSSSTTPSGAPNRGERRSADRLRRRRPARELQRHARCDPVHAQRGRCRAPARARRTRASRSTRVELLHRRLRRSTATAPRVWNGCGRGPTTASPASRRANCCCPTQLPAARRARAATRPPRRSMVTEGALAAHPQNAVVAGDVRANENAELTAVTTLFAREHNRIVATLPVDAERTKNASRSRAASSAAEEQYITYNEFLPAIGVTLEPVQRLRPEGEPRAERRIRDGRLPRALDGEQRAARSRTRRKYSAARSSAAMKRWACRSTSSASAASQMQVDDPPGRRLLRSRRRARRRPRADARRPVATNPRYKNDEQIDDALRSVLFGIPGPGTDPADVLRRTRPRRAASASSRTSARSTSSAARDNGMPTYNQLREALGLAPQSTFAQVTGESSEEFPTDDPLSRRRRDRRPAHPRLHLAAQLRRRTDRRPAPAERAVYGDAGAPRWRRG